MYIHTHLSTSTGTKGITAVYLKLTQRCKLTVFQFKKWYKRLKKYTVHPADHKRAWVAIVILKTIHLRTEILLDKVGHFMIKGQYIKKKNNYNKCIQLTDLHITRNKWNWKEEYMSVSYLTCHIKNVSSDNRINILFQMYMEYSLG